MAGRVTVYDLSQVIATFGPIFLQGFAEGDAISIEFDSPQEETKAGADGDNVRVISASKLATATVRLQRGSPAAAQLRAWKASFRPPLDQAPFIINDTSALLVHQSMQSWIGTVPAPVFSADAPVEEWVFKLGALETVSLLSPTG